MHCHHLEISSAESYLIMGHYSELWQGNGKEFILLFFLNLKPTTKKIIQPKIGKKINVLLISFHICV